MSALFSQMWNTPRKQPEVSPIRTRTASSIRASTIRAAEAPMTTDPIIVSSPAPVPTPAPANSGRARSSSAKLVDSATKGKSRRNSRRARSSSGQILGKAKDLANTLEDGEGSQSASTPPTTTTTTSTPAELVAAEPVEEPGTSAGQPSPSPDARSKEEGEFTFSKILEHRWDDDEHYSFQVDWTDGDPSWVIEATLQEDCPETLFQYWRSKGGRVVKEEDPESYIMFALHKTRRNGKEFLVEWLGYAEQTWEPRAVVEESAPKLLEEYLKTKTLSGKSRKRKRKD